ncbi:hypothetical protein QVD17_17484 [Tagetes erecta]|uniref:Uncharacterized protein n=1 Tax=Tagetes erecta TaxID=13708 RepID=A0AAD8KSB6_TARER|nr:hypothetical protein QVD17_17484 [Tagetes erecta]
MANNTNKNLSLHFPEKQTADLISHYKKLETNLKNLLDKTPLAVDAAITAFEKGVCGAAVCLGLHATAIGICSVFPVPEPFKVTRGVWLIKPTDAGVVIAVDTGVTGNALDERFKREGRCSKQVRVLHLRMLAGLASGAMFAMVTRQPPVDVITTAVVFALADAAIFKAKEKYKSDLALTSMKEV